MTLTQLEQRLTNLEKTVARLQSRLAEKDDALLDEDDIIEGAEYDLTPELIPSATLHFRGRIVAIEKPPARLGLSEAEWDSLPLEDEDE